METLHKQIIYSWALSFNWNIGWRIKSTKKTIMSAQLPMCVMVLVIVYWHINYFKCCTCIDAHIKRGICYMCCINKASGPPYVGSQLWSVYSSHLNPRKGYMKEVEYETFSYFTYRMNRSSSMLLNSWSAKHFLSCKANTMFKCWAYWGCSRMSLYMYLYYLKGVITALICKFYLCVG